MNAFHINRSSGTRYSRRNRDTSRLRPNARSNNIVQGMNNNVTEAKNRGLLETTIGRMAANVLAVNPDDQRAHQLIADLLAEDDARRALKSPFRERYVNEGEIILGEDPFDDTPHRQRLQDFINVLVAGVPGCGKTTLIREIAPQLAVHGCSVLLVDSEKEELRNLVSVFERYGKSLKVTKGRKFPNGLLEVSEEINPFEYLEHIALLIGSALDVLEPGIRLLKEVIYKLYLEYGVFEGKKHFPTLFEVREEVAKNRTANLLTKEGLLARLDTVLLNTPGLRFRTGVSIEQISTNNLLLECAGMAPPARDLLIGSIITKEFLRRKQLRYINAPMTWSVFIDDAQRICTNPEGHLSRFVNVIRSTGIMFGFFVQSIRQVAPAIVSNCSTKLCGILGSAEDYHCMSRMLLLSNEQMQWYANKLERGEFICKLGSVWRTSFLLKVRPGMVHDYLSSPAVIPIERRIGNANIEQNLTDSPFCTTELIEAKEYRNWIPPEWNVTPITETGTAVSKTFTGREKEFLGAVIQWPGQPCSSYNRKLSFSQKVALEVRKQLVEKGLIYEEHVRTQHFGRTAKLLVPTEAGKKLFSQIREKQKGCHD